MSVTPPAKVEALAELHNFEFDGDSYAIPSSAAWDLAVLDALEDEKISTAVRLILGTAQNEKFRAKPRQIADLNRVFEAIQKATGSGN